jgi:hypothetical protein
MIVGMKTDRQERIHHSRTHLELILQRQEPLLRLSSDSEFLRTLNRPALCALKIEQEKLPQYSKGALLAAERKDFANATRPIMALSWLDSHGCALLRHNMGDVWPLSLADYINDNIIPEDKLTLLIEEFSVVATLLRPRAIRLVEVRPKSIKSSGTNMECS